MVDNIDNKTNDIISVSSKHEICVPIPGMEENTSCGESYRSTVRHKYYSLPPEYFDSFKRVQNGFENEYWLDEKNITETKRMDSPLSERERSSTFHSSTDDSGDDGGRKTIKETCIDTYEDKKLLTRSANIKEQPIATPRIIVMDEKHANKETHHKNDITYTAMYKEIYMNKLRDYSFLHAKKLGINNQSPQQLRKMYYDKRQKATVKGNNLSVERPASPNNNDKTNIAPDCKKSPVLRHKCWNRHKDSLTDISNIILDKKTGNKTNTDTDLNIPELASDKEPDIISEESDSSSNTTCKTGISKNNLKPPSPKRSESVESKRRQSEAEQRRGYRLARITSLDNTVSSADTFMKNLKLLKEKSLDE